MNEGHRIALVSALQVLHDLRRDQVIVTTMGAAREWMRLSDHPLDFHYVPSTMGGGIPLALGIALSRPGHDVIVLSGDGSLLMSLGSLVTVAANNVPIAAKPSRPRSRTGVKRRIVTNSGRLKKKTNKGNSTTCVATMKRKLPAVFAR